MDARLAALCLPSLLVIGTSAPANALFLRAFQFAPMSTEQNMNRPGHDYHTSHLGAGDLDRCKKLCGIDPKCKAYTFERLPAGKARCWLKRAASRPVYSRCCVSGVRLGPPKPAARPPARPSAPARERYSTYGGMRIRSPYRAVAALSQGACEEFCSSDDRCKGFTFQRGRPGQNCWLAEAARRGGACSTCVTGRRTSFARRKKRSGAALFAAFQKVKQGGWKKFLTKSPTARVAQVLNRKLERHTAVEATKPESFSLEMDTNRAGTDYKDFPLSGDSFQSCRDACAKEAKCRAYTYVKPARGRRAHCYLKSTAMPRSPYRGAVSGAKGSAIRVREALYAVTCGHRPAKYAATPDVRKQCPDLRPACTIRLALPSGLDAKQCSGVLTVDYLCGVKAAAAHSRWGRRAQVPLSGRPSTLSLSCELSAAEAIAIAKARERMDKSLFYFPESKPSELERLVQRGMGSPIPIAEIQAAYERRVNSGDALPGEKEPTALNTEEVELYRLLLPDFYQYLSFMNISALQIPTVSAVRGRAPAYGRIRDDLVESLSNYACRQVGRLMPGFARIVKGKIGGAPELSDDPDRTIPPPELEKLKCEYQAKGCPRGGQPARELKLKPERPIEVELCTITHAQLAAMLKRDIGLLTVRFLVQGGGRASQTRGWIHPFFRTNWNQLSSPPTLTQTQEELLFKNDASFVTRRLMNFYRFKGSNRNFERVIEKNGKAIRLDESKAPEDLRGEAREQNSSVDARNNRERLRRAVFQWTEGYEYLQMTKFIGSGAKTSRGVALAPAYKRRDEQAFNAFWSDCGELRSVCEAPKEPEERERCQKCALKAVEDHCIQGTETRAASGRFMGKQASNCRGVVRAFRHDNNCASSGDKHLYWRMPESTSSMTDRKGNTYKNWLIIKFLEEAFRYYYFHGPQATAPGYHRRWIPKFVALQLFMGRSAGPAEVESLPANWYSLNTGKRFLDALPITAWQRCYLWSDRAEFEGRRLCDNPPREPTDPNKIKEAIKERYANKVWEEIPLFKMVLDDRVVIQAFQKHANYFRTEPHRSWCNGDRGADDARNAHYSAILKQIDRDLGISTDKELGDAGGAISGTIGPIVGKLLGMLLNAAGMNTMMKTLAKAAGLTPEQSADCEDPEYRRNTMKLSGEHDSKRGCLLRVFAKNFAGVMESVILMLGNKLVDWGVALLRTALQGLKSSLISAAGSVPFAGGFLAMLIDITWEILFNYGLKTLLRALVVNQLPKWLKVREMSSQSLEQLAGNPIVSTVLGIILELIEAAVQYGQQPFLVVGFSSIIGALQATLAAKNEFFWVRALAYAKKEMIRSGMQDSVTEQVLALVRGLLTGAGEAIAQGVLPGRPREIFRRTMNGIRESITADKLADAQKALVSQPVAFLRGLLTERLGPAVLPIIASYVKMPDWMRAMLLQLIDWQEARGGILSALESPDNLLKLLGLMVTNIPVDPASQKLVPDFVSKVVNGDVQGVFSRLVEFASKQATPALERAGLSEEAGLMARALSNPAALGPATLPAMLKPYFVNRLGEAARDTGLAKTVTLWAQALFGPPQTRDAVLGSLLTEAKGALSRLIATARQAPLILGELVKPVTAAVQSAGGVERLDLAKALTIVGNLLRDRVVARVPDRTARRETERGVRHASSWRRGPIAGCRSASKCVRGGTRRKLTERLLKGLLLYGVNALSKTKAPRSPTELLIEDLLDWLVMTLKEETLGAVSHPALNVLVAGLFEMVVEPMCDPKTIVNFFKRPKDVLKEAPKKLVAVFQKFLKALLVDPLRKSSSRILQNLATPANKLIDIIAKAVLEPAQRKTGALKKAGRAILAATITGLANSIDSATVQGLVQAAGALALDKLFGAK